MKKITVFLAAVLLISSAFLGCASKNSGENEVASNKLYLVADGTKRLVQYDTSKELLESALNDIQIKKATIKVYVFSGKKPAEVKDETEPVAMASFDLDSDFEKLQSGYDIIGHTGSKKALNAVLGSGKFYYAKAIVTYTPKGSNIEENHVVYSNDTVYTPLTAEEIQALVAGSEK